MTKTTLLSPVSIYKEMSKYILGELKAFVGGKLVKKLEETTATQMQILAALNCQHLVAP